MSSEASCGWQLPTQSVPSRSGGVKTPPVLLLFSDDSTLFFCRRMRDLLQESHPEIDVQLGWVTSENALSYRQMIQLLPEGPNLALTNAASFLTLLLAEEYSAIITSRMFRGLASQMANPAISNAHGRPCVIGFLGGLEFFPETAQYHRRLCDALYVFPRPALEAYRQNAVRWDAPPWQRVGFGHPVCVKPSTPGKGPAPPGDTIYFFPQALSPSTRRGRMHMLRCMVAIARANPAKTVCIKLRHLPAENRNHLHRERFNYPALLKSISDIPTNLVTRACSMDEALADAALGITATSTAAIDLVREGIPCIVYLDYTDHYLDPRAAPMRRLFAESGLITSLEDMLHLCARAPHSDWLKDMFSPNDLGAQILRDVESFAQRPFQTARVL